MNSYHNNCKHNMDIKSQYSLSFDIWTYIVSYLSTPLDILIWNQVCKAAQRICTWSETYISINNHRQYNWNNIKKWFLQFKRISSIEIASCNCPVNFITSMCNRDMIVSLSKCFSMGQDVTNILPYCYKVAICDISFTNKVSLELSNSLRVLILTNSVFSEGVLAALWSNFPSSIQLLGLGGCKGVMSSAIGHDIDRDIDLVPITREDLVVEHTFVSKPDVAFLLTLFPGAMMMDLASDSLDHLDACLCVGKIGRVMMRALLACSNTQNRTPIHLACLYGKSDRVWWLIKHNSRVDLKDVKGCTALHRAVDGVRGPASATEYVKRGSTDNNYADAADAALECVRALLSVSCISSCFIRNQQYETPVYMAALTGNYVILQELLNALSNAHGPKNDVAESTLDHSNCTHNECVLKPSTYLDTLCVDDKGFTPLHAAALARSYSCCALLLHFRMCCPNHSNNHGSTAVHIAYWSGREDIIELMIAAGGNKNRRDSAGCTPQEYAQSTLSKSSRKGGRGRRKGSKNATTS